MEIKGNLKKKVNARHQRHLLTKFDNEIFDDFLDALDRHFGWRFNPANFTIQLDSILFMAMFYSTYFNYLRNLVQNNYKLLFSYRNFTDELKGEINNKQMLYKVNEAD